MLGLKSRRKVEEGQPVVDGVQQLAPTPIVGKPVVDGQPVEPYELPQDPLGDHEFLEWLEGYVLAREEREATRTDRVLQAIVRQIVRDKGRGFEVTVLNRYTFEFHRLRRQDRSRKCRLELYRRGHWDLNVELWTRAKRSNG